MMESYAYKRGYQQQMEGHPDPERMTGDLPSDRGYRDGARAARRDQHAQGIDPDRKERRDKEAAAFHAPMPVEQPPMVDVTPAAVKDMATLSDHPSAFSDPVPGRKPKRAKPVDPGQSSLFQ